MSSSYDKYLKKANLGSDGNATGSKEFDPRQYADGGQSAGTADSPAPVTEQSQNAAQEFLKGKLAENEYTVSEDDLGIDQEFQATDNEEPESWAEQALEEAPEEEQQIGKVSDLYKEMYGTDAFADLNAVGGDQNAANEFYDKVRKVVKQDGFWESQDLSNLMQKAGHQEHIVNIGNYTKDGGAAVNASVMDGIDFSSVQGIISDRGWEGEKGNSIGQLGSALLAAEVEGVEGGEEKGEIPPIEHSDEIKQATERVRAYEDDVNSGKVTEDIYGGNKGFLAEYNLDLNSGLEGIGTQMQGTGKQKSAEAASNFLNSKATETKKKFNFKPSS